MFTAGFQTFAFQTVGNSSAPIVTTVAPSGGWYEHNHREEAYQRELIREQQSELKRINQELAEAEAEKQRLEALKKAKKKAAEQRAALLLLQEQEISRLRNERIWLMRQIDENESLLILAMMARRRRFSTLALH